MKIDSFEILNEGRGGIKVVGVESIEKQGVTIFTPIAKTYPIPLPEEVLSGIIKLKKYLLETTNLFPLHYFMDFIVNGKITDTPPVGIKGYEHAKHVFETTKIKKVYKKKNGYVLTGMAESYETSRFFAISSPLIDTDDGYDNFDKLQRDINACFIAIAKFIEDHRLRMMNTRQLAFSFFGENSPESDRISKLSDKEVDIIMLQHMESQGYLIIKPEEYESFTQESLPDPEEEKIMDDIAVKVMKDEIKPVSIPKTQRPKDEKMTDEEKKIQEQKGIRIKR